MSSRVETFTSVKETIVEAMSLVPGFWVEEKSRTSEYGMVFFNVDGRQIYATVTDDWPVALAGRIKISLLWDREVHENVWSSKIPSAQITAAPNRSAKAVAGQVTKMLAETEEQSRECLAALAQHREYVAAQEKGVERITALAGVESREGGRVYIRRGEAWGRGSVSSNSVSLDLNSLTLEQAEAILKMLG